MRIKIFIAAIVMLLSGIVSDAAESEVRVFNRSGGVVLGGTLSMPDDCAPKCYIVLATGSGAQDRDETLFGHKPFKLLSDTLTATGCCVLRMDDRGVGASTGSYDQASLSDFIDDTRAGVAYLDSIRKGQPIGIIGHSMGGYTAVKLAADDKRVSFIVTLAAPAWSGDSIVMSQARAIAVAYTGKWEQEQSQRELLDIAKSSMSTFAARFALMDKMMKMVGEATQLPGVKDKLAAQVNQLLNPAYREFLRCDPGEGIKRVNVDWLALNGEKDIQVLQDNLLTIKQLNSNVNTMLLPKHNHLFQVCETGMVDEYAQSNQAFSPLTLGVITSWINEIMASDTSLRK